MLTSRSLPPADSELKTPLAAPPEMSEIGRLNIVPVMAEEVLQPMPTVGEAAGEPAMRWMRCLCAAGLRGSSPSSSLSESSCRRPPDPAAMCSPCGRWACAERSDLVVPPPMHSRGRKSAASNGPAAIARPSATGRGMGLPTRMPLPAYATCGACGAGAWLTGE